jgi:hypothetical protein
VEPSSSRGTRSSGRPPSTRRLQFVGQQGEATTTTTRDEDDDDEDDDDDAREETPGETSASNRPKIYQRGPSSLPDGPILPSHRPVITPCGDK